MSSPQRPSLHEGSARQRAEALPEPVRQAYPWTGQLLEVDGGSLHYLDEGPRDAPVLICVHGNPTWSFYWRRIVQELSDRFRVVVPDHIGCGLSDKPQSWPYRLQAHVDNLQALVEHLGIDRFSLMVHDWGGAIGMGLAGRFADRVDRLIVTNTAAFRSKDIPLSIATVKLPLYGPLAVRGFNGFARVATFRASHKPLEAVAKHGLLAPYDAWATRIATLRFVQDIPMKPTHPSWDELGRVEDGLDQLADRPMLIMWGDDDFCFNPRFRAEWERRFPDATVHAWEDVGHYVMEDAPERVLPLVDAFLAPLLPGAAG